MNVIACVNRNEEVRLKSSSGGVFSLLAEKIIEKNGIVYGVTMTSDCYSAKFIRVSDIDGLDKLRGSKYLQAKMGNTYKNVMQDVVNEKLNSIGEKVPTTLINSVKQWFTGIGDWFANLFNNESKDLGILETTNDDLLGENAKIDATDNAAVNQTSTEKEQGFFEKIWNWVTNLFSSNDNTTDSTSENSKSNNNTFEDNFNVDITESSGDSNSSNPSDLKDDKNTIDTNINESNNLENKNIN